MDGKTAVQPRFVWLIQFTTAIAIILWAVTGWAQEKEGYEKNADFTPLVEQQLTSKITPRSVPATVTTEEESALAREGYVKIGIIRSHLSKTDAKKMKDQILATAAYFGGDVVRFDKDGVPVTVTVLKDKEERKCIRWSRNESPAARWRTCEEWDTKQETSSKFAPGLSTEGTVWRHDPDSAANIARREQTKPLCSQYWGIRTDNLAAMLDTQPEIVSLKCDWVSTNSNKYEMPVLTIEILQGNMERVKLLLAHNANVNAKDTRGITPLLYAAEKGNKDLAELLIAHNADVNAKNGAGDTPLIVAQSNGHDDVAKLLLAQNPDVNTKDSDGDTPRTMQC